MNVRTLPLSPTKTIEEVWTQPATGIPWCDCEHGCHVDYDTVLDSLYNVGLSEDEECLTHPCIVRVAMDLWALEAVCAFFHMGVEQAAQRVHGEVAAKYPLETGLAIVKDFSDNWHGCPEEACGDGWDEYGEMEFPRTQG